MASDHCGRSYRGADGTNLQGLVLELAKCEGAMLIWHMEFPSGRLVELTGGHVEDEVSPMRRRAAPRQPLAAPKSFMPSQLSTCTG